MGHGWSLFACSDVDAGRDCDRTDPSSYVANAAALRCASQVTEGAASTLEMGSESVRVAQMLVPDQQSVDDGPLARLDLDQPHSMNYLVGREIPNMHTGFMML